MQTELEEKYYLLLVLMAQMIRKLLIFFQGAD